jgi:preprotein translocase subunit SecE
VARDRKRAKQRRQRGAAAASGRGGSPAASQPVREDLPGALDHSSADADEFDAALIRGAGGVPAEASSELVDSGDDAVQEPQAPGGTPPRGGGGIGAGGGDGAGGESPSGAPLRGGNRAVGFLGASWAELQRVQWPDRRQVTQATAVVLGFVALAGAYLGLADYVAKEIVELIL